MRRSHLLLVALAGLALAAIALVFFQPPGLERDGPARAAVEAPNTPPPGRPAPLKADRPYTPAQGTPGLLLESLMAIKDRGHRRIAALQALRDCLMDQKDGGLAFVLAQLASASSNVHFPVGSLRLDTEELPLDAPDLHSFFWNYLCHLRSTRPELAAFPEWAHLQTLAQSASTSLAAPVATTASAIRFLWSDGTLTDREAAELAVSRVETLPREAFLEPGTLELLDFLLLAPTADRGAMGRMMVELLGEGDPLPEVGTFLVKMAHLDPVALGEVLLEDKDLTSKIDQQFLGALLARLDPLRSETEQKIFLESLRSPNLSGEAKFGMLDQFLSPDTYALQQGFLFRIETGEPLEQGPQPDRLRTLRDALEKSPWYAMDSDLQAVVEEVIAGHFPNSPGNR